MARVYRVGDVANRNVRMDHSEDRVRPHAVPVEHLHLQNAPQLVNTLRKSAP